MNMKMLDYVTCAIFAVAMVILNIMGHCSYDLPVFIIGMIVLAISLFFTVKRNSESNSSDNSNNQLRNDLCTGSDN